MTSRESPPATVAELYQLHRQEADRRDAIDLALVEIRESQRKLEAKASDLEQWVRQADPVLQDVRFAQGDLATKLDRLEALLRGR